jgi:release factor glutamine methyltransferase
MNIAGALSSAAEALHSAGVAEAAREARSLLAFTLDRDAAFLIAHPEYELSSDEAERFGGYLERRVDREPFQYITGHQEFYGLDFEVTPDVLIPRPETEILVEAAIELLSGSDKGSFCEIGVGSGCISISIVHAVCEARGLGVDISAKALEVARRNAARHGVVDRLTLRQGDAFKGINGKFDLVVSNPPYVPRGSIDSLQAEVGRFEPRSALDGGDDGLDIVKKIVCDAPGTLNPGGVLLMEIGFDQSEPVAAFFDERNWGEPEFLPDLQGIPRTVKCRLRS